MDLYRKIYNEGFYISISSLLLVYSELARENIELKHSISYFLSIRVVLAKKLLFLFIFLWKKLGERFLCDL